MVTMKMVQVLYIWSPTVYCYKWILHARRDLELTSLALLALGSEVWIPRGFACYLLEATHDLLAHTGLATGLAARAELVSTVVAAGVVIIAAATGKASVGASTSIEVVTAVKLTCVCTGAEVVAVTTAQSRVLSASSARAIKTALVALEFALCTACAVEAATGATVKSAAEASLAGKVSLTATEVSLVIACIAACLTEAAATMGAGEGGVVVKIATTGLEVGGVVEVTAGRSVVAEVVEVVRSHDYWLSEIGRAHV